MQAIQALINETDAQDTQRTAAPEDVFDQEPLEFVELSRRADYEAASTGTLLGLLLARR